MQAQPDLLNGMIPDGNENFNFIFTTNLTLVYTMIQNVQPPFSIKHRPTSDAYCMHRGLPKLLSCLLYI